MITPTKMNELEKNKVVNLYTRLNQDLTADIIKRIQKTGDISSFTRSQIKVLIRQGGKDTFYSALDTYLTCFENEITAESQMTDTLQETLSKDRGFKD